MAKLKQEHEISSRGLPHDTARGKLARLPAVICFTDKLNHVLKTTATADAGMKLKVILIKVCRRRVGSVMYGMKKYEPTNPTRNYEPEPTLYFVFFYVEKEGQ